MSRNPYTRHGRRLLGVLDIADLYAAGKLTDAGALREAECTIRKAVTATRPGKEGQEWVEETVAFLLRVLRALPVERWPNLIGSLVASDMLRELTDRGEALPGPGETVVSTALDGGGHFTFVRGRGAAA